MIVLTLYFILRSGLKISDWPKRAASIYFLTAFLVFLEIRVFFLLNDLNILPLKDVSLMLGWHLMFYLAITAFILAAKAKSGQKAVAELPELNFAMIIFSAILVFVVVALFNEQIGDFLEGSFVDKSGIMHFIAFIFSFVSGTYFKGMKAESHPFAKASNFLIATLVFYALVHVWELLNESWAIIPVTPQTGENIEQFLVLPVFICGLIAFYKVYKYLSHPFLPSNSTQA